MATNYARASYTEIYDIQTTPNTPTVIGVHTPGMDLPYAMLGGFFKQFKKFRYSHCDISFVPVATLPLDPLQVGFEAGQSPPQDIVNPLLHRAFMGESLGSFFDTYFPQFELDTSALGDEQEPASVDWSNYNSTAMASGFTTIYYQSISDPHFLKSGVQQGFVRNGLVPLVRRVNSNYQFGPFRNRNDGIFVEANLGNISEFNNVHESVGYDIVEQKPVSSFVPESPALFSSGAYPLDWLDTLANVGNSSDVPARADGVAWLPKLYMYFIMLPPSLGTVMYFRMVIKHYFEFKDFQTLVPFSSGTDLDINPIREIGPIGADT